MRTDRPVRETGSAPDRTEFPKRSLEPGVGPRKGCLWAFPYKGTPFPFEINLIGIA